MRLIQALLLVFVIASCGCNETSRVRVAVAANFVRTVERLAAEFLNETGHEVVISSGSTGQLVGQIEQGAPYDLFLSADQEGPLRLEQNGHGEAPRTYALGTLVVWSAREGAGPDSLGSDFRFLAIGNPETSPYGRAAREALVALGLWEGVKDRIVTGENIAQALHFARSENAEFVVCSLAQVMSEGGSYWEIPPDVYSVIAQDLILLTKNSVAQAFSEFVLGEKGRAIIEEDGYQMTVK